AVVTALAAFGLFLNRRGRVALQFMIVTTAATLSIISSILAVMIEMFLSIHDLTVLVWVIAIAPVISPAAMGAMISRVVARSVGRLAASARSLGASAVLGPAEPGWREFNDLHARLVEASMELAAARENVRKLDEARRQFFAWISHDLRTPLAGVRAMSEA